PRAEWMGARIAVHGGVSFVAPVGTAAGGAHRVLPRAVRAGVGAAAAAGRASSNGVGLHGSATDDAARAAGISRDEVRWADAVRDAGCAHDLWRDPRAFLSGRPRTVGRGFTVHSRK